MPAGNTSRYPRRSWGEIRRKLPVESDSTANEHKGGEMIRKANSVKTSILLVVATCHLAPAQQPTVTTLTVDLANQVEYQADISDPTKFARNANTTPSLG